MVAPKLHMGHAGRYLVLTTPNILLLLSEAVLGSCQSFSEAVS